MGNKVQSNETIVKTYTFKVREFISGATHEIMKSAIKQYIEDSNNLSDWINNQLTNKTICEVGALIPIEKRETSYYKSTVDELWANKPCFKMFTNDFTKEENFATRNIGNGKNCKNIITSAYKSTVNPSFRNVLDLTEKVYFSDGYGANVCSNYKTKLRTLKPAKIKLVSSLSDCDDNTLTEQVIREKQKYGYSTPKDFEKRIEYLNEKEKSEQNSKIIERLQKLYEFYDNNTKLVEEKELELSVKSLVEFGGCRRGEKTMTLNLPDIGYEIQRKDDKYGYIFTLKCSKKRKIIIDVWGSKATIDSNGNDKVDIINTHGKSINFKIINNEMYIDITVDVPFAKRKLGIKKVVGIDVNTKHMLMATNIKVTDSIKGYVNLYKEFLNSKEIMDVASPETKKNFEDMSMFVNFCPIEYNTMFALIFKLNNGDIRTEQAIRRTLHQLSKKFSDGNHETERIYVQNVFSIREQLKHFILLSNRYYSEQSDYDTKMGFIDENTTSNATMDKRRFDKSLMFRYTQRGRQLYEERIECGRKITEIRDNIITYARNVFVLNGYDTIALEYLTNATIQKPTRPTSPKSLLDYFKLKGKPVVEAEKNERITKNRKYYNLIPDENDNVINIEYTEEGKVAIKKSIARDHIMKAVHFAEVKDKFIQLSNNGKTQVALVPSNYTSQMNSETHTVYLMKNPKTKKLVIMDKDKVRPIQEKYKLNGLNADFNSARNIAYIVENEILRNSFLKEETKKYTYNTPLFTPRLKSSEKIITELKKLGMTTVIE